MINPDSFIKGFRLEIGNERPDPDQRWQQDQGERDTYL